MGKHRDEQWQVQAEQMATTQRRAGEQLRQRLAADRRAEVTRIAQHVVDVLAGRVEDAAVDSTVVDPADSRAPAGIPNVSWHKPNLPADMAVHCNAGEYVADRYPTPSRPSVAFNAGFMAAALAIREGLLDPAQFLTDSQAAASGPGAETEA